MCSRECVLHRSLISLCLGVLKLYRKHWAALHICYYWIFTEMIRLKVFFYYYFFLILYSAFGIFLNLHLVAQFGSWHPHKNAHNPKHKQVWLAFCFGVIAVSTLLFCFVCFCKQIVLEFNWNHTETTSLKWCFWHSTRKKKIHNNNNINHTRVQT